MKYNPQVDLQPIFGEAGSTLRDALAEEAGVKAEDIVDADLVLCTAKRPSAWLKGEYFMSGRIDDLECAYTTLWGFLQAAARRKAGATCGHVRQRGGGLLQPAGRTGHPDGQCAGPH